MIIIIIIVIIILIIILSLPFYVMRHRSLLVAYCRGRNTNDCLHYIDISN